MPLPLRVLPTSEPVRREPPALAPRFGPGFYGEELAEALPVRWLSRQGRLEFEPAAQERFLELSAYSHFYDLSQTLTFEGGPGAATTLELAHGWNLLSLQVPAGQDGLDLRVNKLYPREYYPYDPRELGLLVKHAGLHGVPARHGHVTRQHANTVLNRRDMLEGRTELRSTPTLLGIDIQGACNVKPPCVYCAWDYSKEREGPNVEVPFTVDTLGEWGAFFENSAMLVNCSIGEPFMMKNVDPLLDAFGERGKLLELTTNGQILTDANIARLLGRNVHLYVSLDAATPQTYARLRNDRFQSVLDNLRRLVAAKGGRGQLPLIYVVFMPMLANRHEVDGIVKLCAELDVDRLVIRPLNPADGIGLVWERAGYRYDYEKELLPFPELVRISARLRERARQLGVDLSDQLDFGGDLARQFPAEYEAGRREAASSAEPPGPRPEPAPVRAAPVARAPEPPPPPQPAAPLPSLGKERLPICTEPWSSLYVLRRGTLPCCYGGGPIAKMDGYREAWNGPTMQAIRKELLRGRFHGYCHDSPDCPIVKKAAEAHELPPRERLKRWAHKRAHAFARSGFGWPGWLYRQGRHRALNLIGHFRRARPS